MQLDRVVKELRNIETALNELREASVAWTDLLRKMTPDERAEGEKEYAAFDKSQKVGERYDEATTKLQDLRDLELKLSTIAKLHRSRADGELRAEQRQQAQQAAPTQHPAVTAPTFTAPFYQFQPIKLERFIGNKREWPEFYESFKSAIGKQPISKSDKFNLLRNLLGGEAREIIAGFRLEDQNYDVALQLLRDTYGAPEEHIRSLHFELANLNHCRNLQEMKNFLLQLERLSRELNNAGEDIEGPPTHLMLERKLMPAFLRTILNKKNEDPTNWTTTKFRTTLSEAVRREVQVQEVMGEYGHHYQQAKREVVSSVQVQRKWTRNAATPHQWHNRKPELWDDGFTAASVGVTHQRHTQNSIGRMKGPPDSNGPYRRHNSNRQWIRDNRREPPYPCLFCGSNHWHAECHQFVTTEQRIAVLKEKRLCLKCLKPNHRSAECQRPSKCYKCGKRHPTALCWVKSKNARHGTRTSSASTNDREANNSTDGCGTDKPMQMCNAVRSHGTRSLLMTTTASVFNTDDPHRSIKATVFIDPGSHRSFISNKAAERLERPVLRTEEHHLNSFGEQKPKRCLTGLVKVGFKGPAGEKFSINLNSMEFLVNELPLIPLAEMSEAQLQQETLTPPKRQCKPDIMLGMDVWHHLNVVPTAKELPSGFTVCQSKIGKFLSGSGHIKLPQASNVTSVYPVRDEPTNNSNQAANNEIPAERKADSKRRCQKNSHSKAKQKQQREEKSLRQHQRNKIRSNAARQRSTSNHRQTTAAKKPTCIYSMPTNVKATDKCSTNLELSDNQTTQQNRWWTRLASAYSTFILLRDITILCLIAYLVNPIRGKLLSIAGVRRRTSQPLQRKSIERTTSEEERQLRTAPPTKERSNRRRSTSPARLDLIARTSSFAPRKMSQTSMFDTPFGRTKRERTKEGGL